MKEEKKTGKDRTQPATRDEEWSDERLSDFLSVEPPASLPRDYNILQRAYRGMTADLFERFVALFVAAGHDINVSLPNGTTFLDQVLTHRKSAAYADIIAKAGGNSGAA